MKKVIRARTQDASPAGADEGASPAVTPDAEPDETVETKFNIHELPQPPLPKYPPPPEESPPPVVVKQEPMEPASVEEDVPPAPTQTATPEEPPNKELCKDFVKGQCLRPVCRHSHNIKLHLDQLPRLFEGCWMFQNTNNCTRPNCKFMHVSIFEQHKFYREGDLPPHAYAHQKAPLRTNDVSMPPPPIAPMGRWPHTPTPVPAPPRSNVPSTLPDNDNQRVNSVGMGGRAPVIHCIPASNIAAFEAPDDRPPAPPTPAVTAPIAPTAARAECTHCVTMKSQEQFHKNMVSNKRGQVEVIFKQQQDQDNKNMELLSAIMAVKELTAKGGSLKQLKELMIALRRGAGSRD